MPHGNRWATGDRGIDDPLLPEGDFEMRQIQRSPVAVWHHTQDNVTALGGYLVEIRGYTAKELQQYYCMPHRYTKEWEQYCSECPL